MLRWRRGGFRGRLEEGISKEPRLTHNFILWKIVNKTDKFGIPFLPWIFIPLDYLPYTSLQQVHFTTCEWCILWRLIWVYILCPDRSVRIRRVIWSNRTPQKSSLSRRCGESQNLSKIGPVKILIRLRECAGCSKSSLGALNIVAQTIPCWLWYRGKRNMTSHYTTKNEILKGFEVTFAQRGSKKQ